jgi:hypothetical protein
MPGATPVTCLPRRNEVKAGQRRLVMPKPMARRNFQWRRLARKRKSNEGGLSRDQTSLYAKIDIFFPVHGKGDYVGAQSETNVK